MPTDDPWIGARRSVGSREMGIEEAEEEEEIKWVVTNGSCEDEVHPATNVLKQDLYRLWQTGTPTDDAWLILEPRQPTAFNKVEIVNAGSALVEIHGLREETDGDSDEDYELLLSAQQVMSVKDLISKSNRNRAFTYDIDLTHKLSPVAAQHRWRRLRLNCRQPFGTAEHRACIGLAYIDCTPCKCQADKVVKSSNTKRTNPAKAASIEARNGPVDRLTSSGTRTLPSWASQTKPEPEEGKAEKKRKERCPNQSDEDDGDKSNSKLSKSPAKRNNSSISTTIADTEVAEKYYASGASKQVSQSIANKDNAEVKRSGAQTSQTVDAHEKKASPKGRKASKRSPSPDAEENRRSSQPKGPKAGKKSVAAISSLTTEHSKVDQPQSLEDDGSKNGDRKAQDIPEKMGKTSSSKDKDGSDVKPAKQKPGVPRGASAGRNNAPLQDFSKLLDGVVFAISGLQNPERGHLRDNALEMGARYQPDWNSECTLLVCAFADTPKFKQVKAAGGTIVSKDWVPECYKQRRLLDIDRFVMNKGRPWRPPGQTPDTVGIVSVDGRQIGKKISCGSVEEIRQWVTDDMASTVSWLQQQDSQPLPDELERTAAEGILVCLNDTIKSIQENQGVSSIVEKWGFLPRAVKDLTAMEEGTGGYSKSAKASLLKEAEKLQRIYSEKLKACMSSSGKPANQEPSKSGDEEEDFDDDATEVISNVDSQETVDYNSDDTIVMDAESVQHCREKLMNMYEQHSTTLKGS